MKICVIDGQGGGIGAVVIKAIRAEWPTRVEILALGTNSAATTNMMKARANRGATGENAIRHTVREADVVIGPVGIVLANAMMGEVSSEIAAAVADSRAVKLLLPLTQERVRIIGLEPEPLPHLVAGLISELREIINNV